MRTVLADAADFVAQRLAPAQPRNDGKQTPWRGHPVFVAQHATATCCRGCLAKWHAIERGRILTAEEQTHVVAAIGRWLREHAGDGLRLLIILALLIGRITTMVEAQDAPPAARPRLPLELLPDTLAICRLAPGAPVPSWAERPSPFLTLSRTDDELSITTLQSSVPAGVSCERDYRAVRVRGPLPLNLVGILAAIADPLAAAGLSIFAISTYDTDYVLLKARDLETALTVLRQAGHHIAR